MYYYADPTLKEALGKLGMDEIHSSGLRWVADKDKEKNAYVYLALEQAHTFGAIAVYFRFFNGDRPPRPQIYIYSSAELETTKSKAADIHHHLWNAGQVPYCFIFSPSQVLVYNCGKKPNVDSHSGEFATTPHDIIPLLGEIQDKLSQYNARLFDSGLFWDSETGKNFKYDQSAYEQLLIQLKNVKTNIISLVGEKNSALVKRILMMLILIKYLEERKDEHGKGALIPEEFYKEFNKENPTLVGILNDADTFTKVLAKLSSKEHFNGQIFHLSEQELSSLKQIELTIFQKFAEGDVSIFSSGKEGIGQMSLWRLYQFNYLPIELISHIYEDFLTDENGQKKKGVVYTPPYLVQFLIDRSMPLDQPKENFKILDPACGSGIFLVGAFKRLIQWWRINNNWKKPQKENIPELKQILLHNIFGCDLEKEAVTLSYFSLGLALLDALSPKEIWNNVHFDNLIGRNLYAGDFFKTLQENKLGHDFDLIIGNPPFESKFTEWATTVDEAEKSKNHTRPEVPDAQIALLFLEQSFTLLKKGGNSCLILPSGPVLYNTKTHNFKKHLFENNYFKEIYDFTPLRAKLFIGSSSSAKPAVVATFAEKNIPTGKPVHHLIFRQTRASGEKIEFEIDHYDIHKVPYDTALNVSGVWQVNFMGGGRLHRLLEKVSSLPTLNDFLIKMVETKKWNIGEGWVHNPTSKPLTQIDLLLKKRVRSIKEEIELRKLLLQHEAKWITNHDFVETKDFSVKGVKGTKVCHLKYFYRSSKENKEIFKAPHLLIKESLKENAIPVLLSNKYLTFKTKIIGVHTPNKNDISILKELEIRIKPRFNIALVWLLSGQVITNREGVPLKADILSLPYPKSEIQFNDIESILLEDILNYYSNFRLQGEKSDILNPATANDLKDFGATYCLILNSVYKQFKPIAPIIGKEFVAYPFILGDQPEIEIPITIDKIENTLKKLIDYKANYNLWIKRIIKVYDKNVIVLYKPNQKRYWLKSIAIRDADETFIDLYNQGK